MRAQPSGPGLVGLGLALMVGCGGAAASNGPASARTSDPGSREGATALSRPTQQGVVGSGRTPEDAIRLCHVDGAEGRTDYSFVGRYRCADGSMPLGGDAQRGAAARLGNVGPGPDGHIVDLYEVPCASGAVRIYVDAYHCGSVDASIDPMRLTGDQLANMARSIRALHGDTSQRAFEMRAQMLAWMSATRQLTVAACDIMLTLLPADDPRGYITEMLLSLTASVIEDGRDPVDPVHAYVAGLEGVLVYYRARLAAEGETARNAQLDALGTMMRDGTLAQRLPGLLTGCDFRGMGVHFRR